LAAEAQRGSAAFEIALGAISKTPALRAGRQRLWL